MADLKIHLVCGQGFVDPHVVITPDLARQIVAISQVPAFEANTLDRLASIEKWASQFPPLGVISENGKPVSVTGPATFTVPEGCKIPAPVAAGGDALGIIDELLEDGYLNDWSTVEQAKALLKAIRAGLIPGVKYVG